MNAGAQTMPTSIKLPDSTMVQPATVVAQPVHSPRTALLLSAVLPGAGQVYNHQAWKVPIVYAALGTGGYFIYDNYTQMRSCKKEYLYRVTHDGEVQNQTYANDPTANIYNMYETYNQRFQLSLIVTMGLYGLNLLDAFVFGHLFEFEMNDDLSMSIQPFVYELPGFQAGPGLGIVLRF